MEKMKKRLIVISGAMGSGKSAVTHYLSRTLPKAVRLEADWLWDAHPYVVNAETKGLVTRNCAFVLNSFIHCGEYENIVFNWAAFKQEMLDGVLSQLDLRHVDIHIYVLDISEEELMKHLRLDVQAGRRGEEEVAPSVEQLSLYADIKGTHINVDGSSIDEVGEKIIANLTKAI